MEKKTKKRFVWITIICLILLLFLFIALPYWLLPRIVDSIARSAMLDAGLTQPQITTQHVTLFSTQINNLSFESNGIKINCPEIEAKYSPISLIKKEIKSIFVAESCAEFTDILPVELKEKLISTQATLKLSIENKDNYYTGSLNGELLGGNYTSSLSFDIKNGTLIFDGSINPKLKDDFPTPTFVLNYKVTDCYTEAPKGSGELIIPDTNLKLGTSLSITNNVVDISATLNSVVSKNDPYLERLFSKLDKQNLINSLYTEIYSKLSVKLSTSTKLPAWDLVVRLNDFDTSIAMEKNMQLVLNKGFASIHLSGLGERWVLHSIPIYIKEVCIDQLKLSNGKFKILADEDQLLLSEGSINAFGGTLSVYALYLNFNHLNAGFTIFVDDIKLNELITALPNLEGTGSGSLHGKLPVTIYQGKKLKLHNAYLFSKPGITGKLKLTDTKLLQEALLTSGIPEQTCSDLGIALSDLDYSVIRLELIDGGYSEQSLQLQIEGSSHQQKSTIPVELNVNIHGGIEKLLNIGLRSQGILNDRK